MHKQKKANVYYFINCFFFTSYKCQIEKPDIYDHILIDYTDDNALIAKNTSLIVARVPLTVQQKRSWDRNETPPFSNVKDEANLGRAVDLTRLDGSEEDKIRAMMTQSTQDYDPSKYASLCTYTVRHILQIFLHNYNHIIIKISRFLTQK